MYSSHFLEGCKVFEDAILQGMCISLNHGTATLLAKEMDELQYCLSHGIWLTNKENISNIDEWNYILLIWCLILVVEIRWSCRCSTQCWVEWEREKTVKTVIYPLNLFHVVGDQKRWWETVPFTPNTQDRTYIKCEMLRKWTNAHQP